MQHPRVTDLPIHPDLPAVLREAFPPPQPSLDRTIREYDYYAGVETVIAFLEAEIKRAIPRVYHSTSRSS